MNYKDDGNYVSTWTWFWMLFVAAIPVVGWIMIFVWAFTGENESRKNYFRAVLLWFLVSLIMAAGVILVCVLLGSGAALFNRIHH